MTLSKLKGELSETIENLENAFIQLLIFEILIFQAFD